MKRIQFIMIALITLVLKSCYRDIDMEKYRPEPDLVLSGVVSADTNIMLSISRTKFFTDTSRYEVIHDADVSLSVNGVFLEKMQWTTDESFYGGGIYLSTYKPQTADIIRINAETKYGEVWVEETMPSKVLIEDVQFSHKLIYDHQGFMIDKNGNIIGAPTMEITYRITFTDNATQTNFYLIRIENPSHSFVGILDYSLDPVFAEQVSVLDGLFGDRKIQGQGGRSFTDKMINGQCYTIVVKEAQTSAIYDYAPALGRRILLYSITESFYQYLTTMQKASDAENSINLSTFGFAEPVRIFTNIHGGLGIIATSQYDEYEIDLNDILKDF